MLTKVLVIAIRDVMADDILSPDEMERIVTTANAIGVPITRLNATAPDAFDELVIGAINAGMPPIIEHPDIMLRANEVAYAQSPAALMKTVTRREFRGAPRASASLWGEDSDTGSARCVAAVS